MTAAQSLPLVDPRPDVPGEAPASVAASRYTPDPRPMSVAIYLHDLAGGGVERQTLALAAALQARGVAVSLVLHQARGPLLDQVPADVTLVDLHSRRTLQDIPRLAGYLRRARPDVLLANLDHNNVAALMASGLTTVPTRTVICQHNAISAEFQASERWTYRLVPLAYRLLQPWMSRAVAVSDGVAAELTRLAGIPRGRIVTIHNPVVAPDFAAKAAAPVDHPWFDAEAPVFVTAGRFVPHKDHATLLRAFAQHRRHSPSRLLMLGDGPLLSATRMLAGELGISDAVDFLGFRDNPLPWFRRADAFVLSSCTEGFGNVLVEAMACGTPVISTDCPYGPREILEDGRYGALVAMQDPAALAAAMDDLPTLRHRCPAVRLRARADTFTLATCADRYLALFRTLVPAVGAAA
jgi:glycosyltransferase involved in cell wall biosynthesis